MIKFAELLESFQKNAFSGKVFHGTGQSFDKFDQRKSRIENDLWGGGVAYFTDDLSVAKSYAKDSAKVQKTDTPFVYSVELKFKNFFDVDDIYTGQRLIDILPKKTPELREFMRGAGLLNMNSDEGAILYSLEKGKASLTGAEIFKGYSKGMNQTAKVREMLIKMGYDGLRYNGGEQMSMATKHNVYIAYKADSVKILQRFKIVKK